MCGGRAGRSVGRMIKTTLIAALAALALVVASAQAEVKGGNDFIVELTRR
jgi:hypothetical protein